MIYACSCVHICAYVCVVNVVYLFRFNSIMFSGVLFFYFSFVFVSLTECIDRRCRKSHAMLKNTICRFPSLRAAFIVSVNATLFTSLLLCNFIWL